jgi:penicillin-binding protein 1A
MLIVCVTVISKHQSVLRQVMLMQSKPKLLTIFLLALLGICCGILSGAFFGLTHDLPQIRQLESFQPSALTRIYSSDSVQLAELFMEKRVPVSLDKVPQCLISGLIATEDRNFYKHSGVDIKGILRAVVRDILAGEFKEGASTITQQLAKTLFLTSKKTLVRKIKEAILAFQIERRYTKDEILELYLNQIYLGSGAYGVESAANIFFGKSVENLDLPECALIAAMPRAPSRYSPLVNKELAEQRRNIVLKQMFQTNIINASEYHAALLRSVSSEKHHHTRVKAPYFVDHIKKDLEKRLGASLLYRGGLSIYTTLSYELQAVAEKAVENGLAALEERMRKKEIVMPPSPQGALVALAVDSGAILAMVGGRDYYQSSYNRSVTARRQPGSAFKPVIYAHAIERDFPQNMTILDAPIVFKKVHKGKDWKPENFSKTYMGEITLRKALSLSKNIPAVRLLQMLGPSTVVQFAHTLGIESPLASNLSLALGTSEVSLLELTAAYATFPNGGKAVQPYGVMEVIDQNGRVMWRNKSQKKVVMSQAGAAIMTDMLINVIQEGTGKRARNLKRPVAGKTGTTDQFKDALFVGFSPDIAAGVWTGLDNSATLGNHETGARAALPIWTTFMAKAIQNRPYQYFDIPDSVEQVAMDPVTGRIQAEAGPGTERILIKKDTKR